MDEDINTSNNFNKDKLSNNIDNEFSDYNNSINNENELPIVN